MTVFKSTGTSLALVMLMAVAGCGKTPASPTARLSAQAEAAAIASDEGPGLNEEPRISIVEPSGPVRSPRTFTRGNAATLHVSAEQTLPALKALINSAQKTLWMETFNFGNDSMGQQIATPVKSAK